MMRATSRPAIVAGVLGRLALSVVEVRRNGHDGLFHLRAEVVLRGGLEVLEHHRRDLRRRVLLDRRCGPSRDPAHRRRSRTETCFSSAADLFVPAPHEALDRLDRASRGSRPPGASRPGPPDARRSSVNATTDGVVRPAFGVGDDDGLAALEDGNDASSWCPRSMPMTFLGDLAHAQAQSTRGANSAPVT